MWLSALCFFDGGAVNGKALFLMDQQEDSGGSAQRMTISRTSLPLPSFSTNGMLRSSSHNTPLPTPQPAVRATHNARSSLLRFQLHPHRRTAPQPPRQPHLLIYASEERRQPASSPQPRLPSPPHSNTEAASMRVWSLHPTYLDQQGLCGLWRETLLCQKVLAGGTKGK